jgi:hypothetical protein
MMRIGAPFGEGAEHAECAGRDANVDAPRDHRLLGFASASGVDNLQGNTVLGEKTLFPPKLGDGAVP